MFKSFSISFCSFFCLTTKKKAAMASRSPFPEPPKTSSGPPGRTKTAQDGLGLFFSAPKGSQERSWTHLGAYCGRSQAPRAVRKLWETILGRKMLSQSPPGPSKIVLPCRRELNFHKSQGSRRTAEKELQNDPPEGLPPGAPGGAWGGPF